MTALQLVTNQTNKQVITGITKANQQDILNMLKSIHVKPVQTVTGRKGKMRLILQATKSKISLVRMELKEYNTAMIY